MATAAVIGLLCYFLGEAKQRRAFLEAKQSLEVKMVIEEQSAEQVNKMFSTKDEHELFFSRKEDKIRMECSLKRCKAIVKVESWRLTEFSGDQWIKF